MLETIPPEYEIQSL